jgi:hypothetical protein
VHDDRHAGLGQLTPDRIEQRIPRVVPPNLQVRLDVSSAVGERLGNVLGGGGLREERAGRYDVRSPSAKPNAQPVSQAAMSGWCG